MVLRLLFVFSLMAPPQVYAGAPSCKQHFSSFRKAALETIQFTQDFIGVLWAQTKLEKLRTKYAKWKKENPEGTPQEFILEYTKTEKKIPAILDVNGNIRIVDNHHTFYAISLFLGFGGRGTAYVDIIFDYSGTHPATGRNWNKSQMIRHMKSNHWINIYQVDNPLVQHFDKIPTSILALRDAPERSVASLALRALRGESWGPELKGSDFLPHVQNRLLKELRKEGYDFNNTTKEFGSPEHIREVADFIMSKESILAWLLKNLKEGENPTREKKIIEFLMLQIEFIRE